MHHSGPKTHYKSQTANPDFFWFRAQKTGVWILCQINRHKITGRQLSTFRERFFVPPAPSDVLEPELLAVFSQVENDVVFHDASGEKNGRTNTMSLEQEIQAALKEEGFRWGNKPTQ